MHNKQEIFCSYYLPLKDKLWRYCLSVCKDYEEARREVAGEDSRSYAETIADEQAETPYQKLESEAVRTMVGKMIETLNRQEQAVVCSHFGLNGHESRSLGEIGKELRITYERARQIQCAALVKLPRRIKKLEQTETMRIK